MLNSKYVIGKFYQLLEAYKAADWVEQISMYFPDSDPVESYEWLGMVPALRAWTTGARDAKEFIDNSFAITNAKYESTVDLPVQWLTGDKSGQVDTRISELVQRVQAHWANLISTLIINGHTGDCYDGYKFFAANHSEGDSGTQKNLVTKSTIPALQVVAPTKPTVTESVDAILAVIAHMLGYKDDRGEPLQADAKQFVVQAGPALWTYLVHGTLGGVTEGGNNVIQELSKKGFSVNCIANPHLVSWTDTFVVMRADGVAKPFIRQEQEAVSVAMKDENSEYCFDYDRVQAGVKVVRAAGYGLWQQAIKAVLST